MRRKKSQENQSQGLSEEKMKIMRLITESAAIVEYMKTSLSDYCKDSIDKETYIMGNSQCLSMLSDKLSSLFFSVNKINKF